MGLGILSQPEAVTSSQFIDQSVDRKSIGSYVTKLLVGCDMEGIHKRVGTICLNEVLTEVDLTD